MFLYILTLISQVILPSRIVWPQTLQIYPDCLGQLGNSTFQNSSLPHGDKRCMRSCRGPPFYFRSWESSLAWVACGLGPDTCSNLSIPYFPDFQRATGNISR